MIHKWFIFVLFVSFRAIDDHSRNSQNVLFVSCHAYQTRSHKQSDLFYYTLRNKLKTEKTFVATVLTATVRLGSESSGLGLCSWAGTFHRFFCKEASENHDMTNWDKNHNKCLNKTPEMNLKNKGYVL